MNVAGSRLSLDVLATMGVILYAVIAGVDQAERFRGSILCGEQPKSTEVENDSTSGSDLAILVKRRIHLDFQQRVLFAFDVNLSGVPLLAGDRSIRKADRARFVLEGKCRKPRR